MHGNGAFYDIRLIYMGLGGGLPLDKWHARPTGVWICPDVHEQAPSYGLIVQLPCGCLVEGKAKGKYPDRKLPCASRAGSSTRS